MGLFPCKPFFPGDEANEDDEEEGHGRHPYGRTSDSGPDPFLSKYSYVHWKVCKNYLKCDIKPLKKSKRNEDYSSNISLESLPTDFFDRDYPGGMERRSKRYFEMDGEIYERVVGYRELMMKREHAQYLKELKIETRKSEIKGYPIYRNWRLARGGGKNAFVRTDIKPAEKKPEPAKGAKKGTKKGAGKKGKSAEPKSASGISKKPVAHKKAGGGGGGCFSWFSRKHTPTNEEIREKVKKNADHILKHQSVKKWKWPNKRKRPPVPPEANTHPGKYVVLLHRLYRMPQENEERDNEWLYLSSSTEDHDPNVVTHFEKDMRRWMTEGISFESQKLFRQLHFFWVMMTFSGRSFLHHKNNFYRGHIEFSSHKTQMISFFLTTIFLWTVLCMSVCSYTDINTQLNVHQSPKLFLQVEKIELRKYWLPYAAIIGNLILVTFWSLSIILGDGPMVAHYLNCWCAALHEMETSGALDIRKLTVRNLLLFLGLTCAYVIMFLADWPGLVRGSCMLTSMLLLRPSAPLIRINQPGTVLIYQWIGLGIQIYILFCARLVMCMLQVFAQMVRNVCEMWNFKYALRFKLLAKENRGQLFNLELNHSLGKLWSHHKLIVRLLDQYGAVFCVGIMCYIIPQVCIVAVALASLILSDEARLREEFYRKGETHIKIYSDQSPTIRIPYYHSILEESIMTLFIFIHILTDFFFTTETLVAATDAFMSGAEFVRRSGLMTCAKSHERRLILSLQWSFCPTRLHALTANRYFTLDRHSLLKLFTFIILVFTILIRTHTPDPPFRVTFPKKGSCKGTLGQTLIHGICTIRENPETTPIPPPPPADYYFFMEHCEDIKINHQNEIKSFEYYSGNVSGVVQKADKPPFQICKVTLPDNTRLPKKLEEFGRYFQDHGNPKLRETLSIYLSQTYDPSKINYLSLTGATLKKHSDSTGGGYCGPDMSGQDGKLCEWVEYYRDCVVVCYSNVLGKRLLLPKMWRKTGVRQFTLYSDYSKIDCGLNPFGWKFQGDPLSVVEEAYDCFGNLVTLQGFDHCSNIPWKEPMSPFTPARGDPKRLYRGYTSDWNYALKTFTAASTATIQPCDKCYDYQVSQQRCSTNMLVQEHCPYARYWGELSGTDGYYLADYCFQLNIDVLDSPKPTGFCKWHYVQGGIDVGHVVSQVDYDNARVTQWNKVWDLSKGKDKPPCQQPGFSSGALRLIQEQLLFKHVCLSGTKPAPGSCGDDAPDNSSYIYAFRPYEMFDCKKFRQIRLDYEVTSGNQNICDYPSGTAITPENTKLDLSVKGSTETFFVFYGCNGKLLLPTNKGRKYHCISPESGGHCEVDAAQGFYLYGECTDAEVLGSKSAVIGTRPDVFGWTLGYGLCSALIDYGDPIFKDERRKLLSDELVYWLKEHKEWKNWADSWTAAYLIHHAHPGGPAKLPNGKNFCGTYSTNYCGPKSFPLHYPFDGVDSVGNGDKFLCNWEAYLRDCVQPFESKIYGGWVYLPITMFSGNLKLKPPQRKFDPLLNTFWPHTYSIGCDIRKLPAAPLGAAKPEGPIYQYWKDECGWTMNAEFVDTDLQSIGIMPAILPLPRMIYSDDGQQMVEDIIHCYESEYAIYRCLHPDISPLCKSNLTIWDPIHGPIDEVCYRFNSSCYQAMNKQPIGDLSIPEYYPEGFCKGYCPEIDKNVSSAISESFMAKWRNMDNLVFLDPPCKWKSSSDPGWKQFVWDPKAPRDIEFRLFFQFHCSDHRKKGVLRDPLGPSSGSFHRPMYRDEITLNYKFIPLQLLRDHLTKNFGPYCDYNGHHNEINIYPPFFMITDSATGHVQRVERSELIGCHGKPLIWFLEEYRQNTAEMATVGINDPYKDHHLACYGPLLGGWCEAVIEPLIFLRDDFEFACKGAGMNCNKDCAAFQGDFATHPLVNQIEDVPGYYPFVKSKKKYVLTPKADIVSSHTSTRTDLPYRRLFVSEFKEATDYWGMYKEPKRHVKYIEEVLRRRRYGPDESHCFHYTHYPKFVKNCIWPLYLKFCYVPCNIIYPKGVVTQVSQSLVDRIPGQSDMYLKPVPYAQNDKQITVPRFIFADCMIDPLSAIRDYQDKRDLLWSCGATPINATLGGTMDNLKWLKYPEYFPDHSKQVTDPSTGFTWIPWKIDYPKFIDHPFEERNQFYDPTDIGVHSATYKSVFASPYLACPRMSQPHILSEIRTAYVSYWNYKSIKYGPLRFSPMDYSYDPQSPETTRTCRDTAVKVYVYDRVCKSFGIKSPVLPMYGFCRAIFPAQVAHSQFAALVERAQPPEGCITRTSHPSLFETVWYGPGTGYKAFGMTYTMPDVYQKWNSYCHSCAYTREMHRENVQQVWCGNQKDKNEDCQSRVESKNRIVGTTAYAKPIVHGEGIFYKHGINHGPKRGIIRIGVIWKIMSQYACWDATLKFWRRRPRWRTYHPWSQKNENVQPAAYLIHIALNALGCPYPCKSPDESQDCNSKCPLKFHNPCVPNPEVWYSHLKPPLGINYSITLKENGKQCQVSLLDLNPKLQGLALMSEFGVPIVRNAFFHPNRLSIREGYNITRATSELILLDDKRGVNTAASGSSVYGYQDIWYVVYQYDSTTTSKHHSIYVQGVYDEEWLSRTLDGPRFIAVHPVWLGVTNYEQYSTYCAAFEHEKCEVLTVDWDRSRPPPSGQPTYPDYIRVYNANPHPLLKIVFSPECTANDKQLVNSLLSTNPKGRYEDTSPNGYCCIPWIRGLMNRTLNAAQWERQYFATARDTWTQCADRGTPSYLADFGFIFRWNKFARFLSACPHDNCHRNTCANKLRGLPTSKTDLCQRQFDPDENFITQPLPACQLPLPPF